MTRRGGFLLAFSLLLVPLSLGFAAWQSYVCFELEKVLKMGEERQQKLYELNKQILARYSAESSPSIIEQRAARELGMARPRQDQILKPLVAGGRL